MNRKIKIGDIVKSIRYGDMFVIRKIVREYDRNLAYVEYIYRGVMFQTHICLNDDLSAPSGYRNIDV